MVSGCVGGGFALRFAVHDQSFVAPPRTNAHRRGSTPVWFAPSREILFNSAADNQMANEPFSRVLMGRELEFSGWNLLNPKEERFEFRGQTGLAGFG